MTQIITADRMKDGPGQIMCFLIVLMSARIPKSVIISRSHDMLKFGGRLGRWLSFLLSPHRQPSSLTSKSQASALVPPTPATSSVCSVFIFSSSFLLFFPHITGPRSVSIRTRINCSSSLPPCLQPPSLAPSSFTHLSINKARPPPFHILYLVFCFR